MRKFLIFIVFALIALFFAGCSSPGKYKFQKGVDKELAQKRKTMISDLRYRLFFNIPAFKPEQVDGIAKISFSLQVKEDIVLDFREDSSHVKKVIVNGKEANYKFENEHIVIPESMVIRGKNEVEIVFVAGNQSLNRNDEFLYTLLVPDRARTLFPCFDQPDMKALFTLSLEIPEEWIAVSNTLPVSEVNTDDRRRIVFNETEPLSTYLFSFVAGKMSKVTETRDGRTIAIYHRETDERKLAQTRVIFDQVYASLDWMEKYTDIPYPFTKYELIILPGFQYGGMEHTGATLYNDKRMFLAECPTIEEELGRMELIAHETAHMWFGDYVTMAWFDDVWTKEVFANYFAALMTEPQFPKVNHSLNELKNFWISSYSEDRTSGTNPVKQELDNLNHSGLVYGQIIYNKAPIIMKMLVKLMGEKSFRQGIREYLMTYAYSNATWENLITILDRYTPQDLEAWSKVWVNERGMPEIFVKMENSGISVIQKDIYDRGIIWPQDMQLMLVKRDPAGGTDWKAEKINVQLYDSAVSIKGFHADYVLPYINGEGYGYFVMDDKNRDFALRYISDFNDPVMRLSLAMNLNENMLNGNIKPSVFVDAMLNMLEKEKNPLVYSTVMGYVRSASVFFTQGKNKNTELALLRLCGQKGDNTCQLIAFRTLMDIFTDPDIVNDFFIMWDRQKPFEGIMPSENDYMKMAYELAVRMPEKYNYIIDRQAGRILNPDRKKEFLFVGRAVSPDSEVRDSLFNSLLEAENRRIEPWVSRMLFYLNHPLRQAQALKYINPSLAVLEDIQRTGDIFFPKNWIYSCLSGHNTCDAGKIVRLFLDKNTGYPALLKNKILQSADHLFRIEKMEMND